MLKVLLTGVSSSPGYKTLLELIGRGFTVYGVYNQHPVSCESSLAKLVKLDLTDFSRVIDFFNNVKPDIVVHMAALGNVDECERDKAKAWLVNVEVTRLLAKLASRRGAYMLYLSTDYVFDGQRGMYREDEPPYPINFYGLTKMVGEEIVKSLVEKHVVVRTSAIYGLGPGRKNFGKFLLEALSQGKEVKALVDQWLSPTLNTLLAKAVAEIIEKELQGVYHVAGERISRYDFAVKLAKRFGFDTSLIKPARMSEFTWYAPRPRDSSLDCTKALNLLKTNFHSIDYSLDVLYMEWSREKGE